MAKLKEYADDLRNKISSLQSQISHIEDEAKQAENIDLPSYEEIKEFFLLPLEDKEEFINNRKKEQTNEKIRSENK